MNTNSSEQSIDILFNDLSMTSSLVVLIIVIISIIQIAVLFAQLKLYSINTTLKNELRLMNTIDDHIFEMKLTAKEQVKILNEINNKLASIESNDKTLEQDV